MNEGNAWAKAAASAGSTDSERALAQLARKAFLSMWSYPNVYSDEGRAEGSGDGKEVVDLLVVFGNDILLFSDKACAFHSDIDVKVAWPRWYKRAIEKSARQLAGAESFLRRFPDRVFVDKSCTTRLPVIIPDPSSARFHLIAVTRGGHSAAERYFGRGSSGSLMLNSLLEGRDHYDHPFEIGFPLPGRRFVHVLDEMTVAALLGELDTLPDLVDYLTVKEKLLLSREALVHVAGEEELLAQYMCTMHNGRHVLPVVPPDAAGMTILEGDWRWYRSSPQRAAKRNADRDSYVWDALIEHQASFVRAGTAIGLLEHAAIDHERILRALAEESRLARRVLADNFKHVLSQNTPGRKFARIIMSPDQTSRAYVFLTAPRPPTMNYGEYRQVRTHSLLAYCHGLKKRYSLLTNAVGIASEPYSQEPSSQDIVFVDLKDELTPDESAAWDDAMQGLEVLQTPERELQYFGVKSQEFPMPFDFGDSSELHSASSTTLMNRAQRRKSDRDSRRASKKNSRQISRSGH